MDIFSQINSPINLQFHLIFKVVLVIFLIFYLIFALLTTRQIQVMNKTLTTIDKSRIILFGNIHLLIALAVLVIVIFFF